MYAHQRAQFQTVSKPSKLVAQVIPVLAVVYLATGVLLWFHTLNYGPGWRALFAGGVLSLGLAGWFAYRFLSVPRLLIEERVLELTYPLGKRLAVPLQDIRSATEVARPLAAIGTGTFLVLATEERTYELRAADYANFYSDLLPVLTKNKGAAEDTQPFRRRHDRRLWGMFLLISQSAIFLGGLFLVATLNIFNTQFTTVRGELESIIDYSQVVQRKGYLLRLEEYYYHYFKVPSEYVDLLSADIGHLAPGDKVELTVREIEMSDLGIYNSDNVVRIEGLVFEGAVYLEEYRDATKAPLIFCVFTGLVGLTFVRGFQSQLFGE